MSASNFNPLKPIARWVFAEGYPKRRLRYLKVLPEQVLYGSQPFQNAIDMIRDMPDSFLPWKVKIDERALAMTETLMELAGNVARNLVARGRGIYVLAKGERVKYARVRTTRSHWPELDQEMQAHGLAVAGHANIVDHGGLRRGRLNISPNNKLVLMEDELAASLSIVRTGRRRLELALSHESFVPEGEAAVFSACQHADVLKNLLANRVGALMGDFDWGSAYMGPKTLAGAALIDVYNEHNHALSN